jgi:predicted nucleotidyltransferase
MLNTKLQSIEAIKTIAKTLDNLNDQVVYVGGAVASIYADDPGAQEIRPTKDVDIVIKIASALELETFRQQLAERGIHLDKEAKITCRFKYQNISLDVMATKEIGWAPANPWFKSGFNYSDIYELDDVSIKIMPVAYYLASKFTAFKDRGKDPRTSYDFEDIIYVLDNRTTLIKDILESDNDVKMFLIAEFKTISNNTFFQEAILAHLEPATQTRRYELLQQKLESITSSY